MSSSLSVFLVDPARLNALVGAADPHLLRELEERLASRLESSDRWFSSEIENGAPTAAEALRALVDGGPYSADREHAFRYGYAYEQLCSVAGWRLDNSSFSPFRGSWLDEVDQGLKALGVSAVSVSDFFYGSALPAGVPTPETYPCCDEWSHAACVTALEQFEQGRRDGLAPDLDREVAEAASQVVSWLRRAVRTPDLVVIGFFY